MQKTRTAEQLSQIMDMICRRIDRRHKAYVKQCPVLTNESINTDFSTSLEKSALFRCKQELSRIEAAEAPIQKERAKLVIQIARAKRISRQLVRAETKDINISDMQVILGKINAAA